MSLTIDFFALAFGSTVRSPTVRLSRPPARRGRWYRTLPACAGLGLTVVTGLAGAAAEATKLDLRDPATAREFSAPPGQPAVEAMKDGLAITGRGVPPSAAWEKARINVGTRRWAVIRMRTTAGRVGGLGVVTSKDWKQTFNFPIRADGALHSYNVGLGDIVIPEKHRASEFGGELTSLRIIPTYEPDETALVESIEFRDAPAGDAFIIPEYCGAAEAFYRAGRVGTIAVRVRNGGGSPLRDLRLEFSSDGPVQQQGPWRGAPASVAPDEPATLYADVLATAPGRHRFQVKVSLPDGLDRVTMTGVLRVDEPLEAVQRAVDLTNGEIPPVKPLRTPYDIGVYYFSGWSHLLHWPSITLYAERRPLLGYHDESSPIVAAWNTKWALEHGINFFNILLYWKDGKIYNEEHLEGFIRSRFFEQMGFMVTWSNDIQTTLSEADFMGMVQYWIDRCFLHPNYKRSADGRPMVGFFDCNTLMSQVGGEAEMQRLMKLAEQRARAAGYPGIFWVAATQKHDSNRFQQYGYEGYTYYNYPMSGAKGFRAAPARTFVETAPATWKKLVAPGGLTLLPVGTGFDHTPTRGKFAGAALYGYTPELFARHLRDAKAFVDSLGQKTILIEAWNEWGEGSCVGPYALTGFDFMDKIPAVFAPDEKPRPIVVPEDVGVPAPEIEGLWTKVSRPAFQP